jgi:hypothetical protein
MAGPERDEGMNDDDYKRAESYGYRLAWEREQQLIDAIYARGTPATYSKDEEKHERDTDS